MHISEMTEEETLEHFGMRGMRWGFRKKKVYEEQESTVDPASVKSPITKVDKTIDGKTQGAAHEVAGLLKSRYGYEVTELRAIEDKRQFKNYLAYVEAGGSGTKGTIHIQRRDLTDQMKQLEESGWFGPGTGNVRAVMTHETAHSMFHAEEVSVGLLGKTVGGHRESRDKALDAAFDQAKADGIKERNVPGKISGYAKSSFYREEAEAEMFSQYHWNPNPPKFIKVWGETLHAEMGVDATPFREVVKK